MTPMSLTAMRVSARQATALMKVLSNDSRLMILCHLRDGEKSVGALEDLVGLGQSALSQHLARLRKDSLVQTRRQAQAIFYRLADDRPGRVIDLLYDIYCRAQARPARPARPRQTPQKA